MMTTLCTSCRDVLSSCAPTPELLSPYTRSSAPREVTHHLQAPFSKPLRTKGRRSRNRCLPVPAIAILLGIGIFAILG
jgi:hypothetical protein